MTNIPVKYNFQEKLILVSKSVSIILNNRMKTNERIAESKRATKNHFNSRRNMKNLLFKYMKTFFKKDDEHLTKIN